MPVHALTQVDPTQFFRLPSTNGTGTQRLDSKVSGVAVSNDFSGRLSVTTAEGDAITLSADLESDFRAVNYKAQAEGDGKTVGVDATYAEYSLTHEFGVTLEGDLNEEEIQDLEKLFRNVANLFKQYLSGQSGECTFYSSCAERVPGNVRPNCGGGFVSRPIRPSVNWNDNNFLLTDPASTKVEHRTVDLVAHGRVSAKVKTIPPEKR